MALVFSCNLNKKVVLINNNNFILVSMCSVMKLIEDTENKKKASMPVCRLLFNLVFFLSSLVLDARWCLWPVKRTGLLSCLFLVDQIQQMHKEQTH